MQTVMEEFNQITIENIYREIALALVGSHIEAHASLAPRDIGMFMSALCKYLSLWLGWQVDTFVDRQLGSIILEPVKFY